MQAADDCDPVLFIQAFEVLQDRMCQNWIQTGNWLIGEDEFWLLHQRPGNANTLLLPAAEFIGALICLISDAHPLQSNLSAFSIGVIKLISDTAPCGRVAQPASHHVRQDSRALDQVELLKDHTDFSAHITQVFPLKSGYVHAIP